MKKQTIHCALATLPGLALTALLLWLGTTARAAPLPPMSPLCVNATGSGCDAICSACYSSVQAAIDAAAPGDEIRIAAGTYTDPGGTVAAITRTVTLRGGYDQPCGDGDFDPDLYHTVLDGQWGGSVISITNAGDVLLEHLTLTHGDGSDNCGSGYGCGGGIYATDTNLHVGNCVITDNVANSTGNQYGSGGGVYAYNFASGGIVEIWESRIVSNTANRSPATTNHSSGGGVCVLSGAVTLVGNEILNNVGSTVGRGGDGGGVYLSGVRPGQVLSNTIRGNKAATTSSSSGRGGGLCLSGFEVYVAGNDIEDNWTNPHYSGDGAGVYVGDNTRVHLTRNRIISNATNAGWARFGGGVYISSYQPVTLSNNLIARNDAGDWGGGVCVLHTWFPPARVLLVNNTVADNNDSGIVAWMYVNLTVTNNLVAGQKTGLSTLSPFTGTIVADHNLFWNSSDPITGSNAVLEDPRLSADYHLRSGSPAVDAGVTIPWLATDLEGNTRPQGSGYDLGAYEGERGEVFLPLVLRDR